MNNGKPKRKVEVEVEESSGNVFRDLGLDNPDALLATSTLIVRLHVAMQDRKLTEAAAARQLGIARKDLAALLRGDFDLFSDAEISSFTRILRRPPTRSRKAGSTKTS